jgi:hypothetical protein
MKVPKLSLGTIVYQTRMDYRAANYLKKLLSIVFAVPTEKRPTRSLQKTYSKFTHH